ncbi:MAG TPA: hypothetical protein VF466_04860 [Candidatus Saccharimonadales bacterium]
MSDVVKSILTDASVRTDGAVEQAFISNAEAGGPWGSEAPTM